MELVWVKEGRLKIAPRTFLGQGDVIPDGLIEPEKIREYIARGWVMRAKLALDIAEDIEVIPSVVVRAGVREPETGAVDEQKEPAPDIVEDIEVISSAVDQAGAREPEKGVIDEQKEHGSKARKRGRPRK